jgi:predicted acyl esterase
VACVAAAMRTRLALALALVASALLPAAAGAADVPANATWTEATIPSSDGVMLHADILRPKNLPATAKTPVIL